MFGKKQAQEDYIKCCLNCEHAIYSEGDEMPEKVQCARCKKTKDAEDCCRHHVYDLLKRKPFRPSDIPSLDPDALML